MGLLEGPEFIFRVYNQAAQQVSGLPAEKVIGRPVAEALPDAAEAVLPFLKRAYAGEKVDFMSELDLPGGRRFVNVVYIPLPDLPGAPRRILFIAVDHTEIRAVNAELERRLAAQAASAEELRESERRFRAMVDSIPQLAWMANADGYIFWYNRRWYEYTGSTPEQMEGWGWQSVHDPKVLPRVLERWSASIAQGRPFDMEFPLKSAEGRFRWFLTRVMPLKDAEGRVVRWFGTNTDINENVELAEALRKANEDLELRVESRTRELKLYAEELKAFSYSAAHDLRAPVRTITSFTQLAVTEGGSGIPQKAREHLARVLRAAETMTAILDGLLRLSRLTTSELDLAAVDVSALAAEVAAELASAEPGRAVELSIEPGLTAMGDAKLMRMLLQNLLGNAWKFTSRRPNAKISLSREEPAGAGGFAVQDNGVGFDAEFTGKLFEPFQRLHSDDEFAGTGLGLAICKRIVQRHGGRIWAASAPGKGARISFTLGSAPI